MNIEDTIKAMWSNNAFMNLLKIKIQEIHCGKAILVMPVDCEIHTNHWLGVHGGALAAFADSISGITCASIGKIAQTLNMNINYISNIRDFGILSASSEIAHQGKSTINIRVTIKDATNNTICDVTSIMFVMGDLASIPESW